MAASDPSSKKLGERDLFRKQETQASKETKGTTIFKEAWRKEQEFKLRQMQRPPPSSSPNSQELPPKPNLVGLKRKAVSPSFPQPSPEGCRNSQLPQPRRPPVVNAETRGAQLYRPSPLGPQYKKPPLHLHSPRELKYRLPADVPNQTTFGQPPQQSRPAGTPNDPSSQMASLWCDLCKVPCMNEFNLREHNRGRKHKAKLESASGSKRGDGNGGDQTVLCHECNVKCPNEMSLAQHRSGKNHTLRLVKLGMLMVKKETPGFFGE